MSRKPKPQRTGDLAPWTGSYTPPAPPKLRSQSNAPGVEYDILRAARGMLGDHRRLDTVYEHGHWWIVCGNCGAQWDAVDASGPGSAAGFGFEMVTQGDGDCGDWDDRDMRALDGERVR